MLFCSWPGGGSLQLEFKPYAAKGLTEMLQGSWRPLWQITPRGQAGNKEEWNGKVWELTHPHWSLFHHSRTNLVVRIRVINGHQPSQWEFRRPWGCVGIVANRMMTIGRDAGAWAGVWQEVRARAASQRSQLLSSGTGTNVWNDKNFSGNPICVFLMWNSPNTKC